MSIEDRPLPTATDTAARIQSLAVDAALVVAAAFASVAVTGWLAEALVWLTLAVLLTWRPR